MSDKPKVSKLDQKKKTTEDNPAVAFLEYIANLIKNDPNQENIYNLTVVMNKVDIDKEQRSTNVLSTIQDLSLINLDIDRAKMFLLKNGEI